MDDDRRFPKAAYAALALVGAAIAGVIVAACVLGTAFLVAVVVIR